MPTAAETAEIPKLINTSLKTANEVHLEQGKNLRTKKQVTSVHFTREWQETTNIVVRCTYLYIYLYELGM